MRPNLRLIRRLSVVGATALLAAFTASPAYAAPPANDTFAGSVQITSVPFSATQDVTEATTDADDANGNLTCGAPALDASVWYSVTMPTDEVLVADVSDSTYSAGVLVLTGEPGSFTVIACGPGAVAFGVVANTTYHLLIIDDQYDGGGNGGILNLVVDRAPPAPEIDLTVDPAATFNPSTGTATVTGTVTCSGVVDFTFIDVELRQQVGRGEVLGFGTMSVTCDDVSRPWAVEVAPILGTKFAGGKAASVTFAVACGPAFCGFDYEERTVRLSGH